MTKIYITQISDQIKVINIDFSGIMQFYDVNLAEALLNKIGM